MIAPVARLSRGQTRGGQFLKSAMDAQSISAYAAPMAATIPVRQSAATIRPVSASTA